MTTVPLKLTVGGGNALRLRLHHLRGSFRLRRPGPAAIAAASVAPDQFHYEVAIAVVVVRSHRLTFEISEYTVGWLVLSQHEVADAVVLPLSG